MFATEHAADRPPRSWSVAAATEFPRRVGPTLSATPITSGDSTPGALLPRGHTATAVIFTDAFMATQRDPPRRAHLDECCVRPGQAIDSRQGNGVCLASMTRGELPAG